MEKVQKIRECNKREAEEEDNVLAALFTAGIVLLMVCLKRALMLFLVEQWRAWIFLVLNILLWVILFTSTNSSTTTAIHKQPENLHQETKVEKEKTKDECGRECEEISRKLPKAEGEEAENVEADGEHCKLSKEELNERVEAFIAMFRQHLASDARKGRKSFYSEAKESDTFKFHKGLAPVPPLLDVSVSS